MARGKVDRIRAAIKFVVLWLVAVYIIEVMREDQLVGVGAVLIAVAVNLYARKKAAASVEPNRTFYFWLYLPVVLLFGLPLLFKYINGYSGDEELSWWARLGSVLPFVLRLGIPAGTLLWVYMALGKLAGPHATTGPAEDAAADGSAAKFPPDNP